MNFEELHNAVQDRFPNANFSISCFDTIEEIENKILAENEKYIIYYDTYYDNVTYPKKKMDYFIVKRKKGEKHIYYKDVIDKLIKSNFDRSDCNNCFLENITKVPSYTRNNKSIPLYSSFWGS